MSPHEDIHKFLEEFQAKLSEERLTAVSEQVSLGKVVRELLRLNYMDSSLLAALVGLTTIRLRQYTGGRIGKKIPGEIYHKMVEHLKPSMDLPKPKRDLINKYLRVLAEYKSDTVWTEEESVKLRADTKLRERIKKKCNTSSNPMKSSKSKMLLKKLHSRDGHVISLKKNLQLLQQEISSGSSSNEGTGQ